MPWDGKPKGNMNRRPSRQERALELANNRYDLKRSYAVIGDNRYWFSRREDRKKLRADLKYAWREKYPDDPPPPDTAFSSVIEDLCRLAENIDPAPEEAQTASSPAYTGDGLDGEDDLDGQDGDRGIGAVMDAADCPIPAGYQVPAGYKIRPGGSIWNQHGRFGPVRASWDCLFPVQVYIDPDGSQWIELTWRERGRWISRLVRRSVSKNGRKLVTELGDAGLPITDSDGRETEKWLAAAELANQDLITRHPVARQLGWQKDGTFVTGPGSPCRVEPAYDQQRGPLKAHRPEGSIGGWRDAIGRLEQHPACLPALYAGPGAVLLELFGIDSFTLDYSSPTTRGKTTAAMCGASWWHDPAEDAEGMFHWRTSMYGVEMRLNMVNGLVVVMDDTRTSRTAELVDNVVYQIPKNCGTVRGGDWASMLSWRVIVISTGEQPILTFTTHGGASARVLSIHRAPFGSAGQESRAAAESVKNGITANFGIAGPMFVERLRALSSSARADLTRRHKVLTEEFRGPSDISARRAPLVACLYLAGQLAAEWKIVPFGAPPAAAWMALFSEGDQDRNDNRPEQALDAVREIVASNGHRMFGRGRSEPPAGGWIGHYAEEGPALLPKMLGKELAEHKIVLEAVVPGWLEMGALVTMESQRPNHLIPRGLGIKPPGKKRAPQSRHYIFREEFLSLPEALSENSVKVLDAVREHRGISGAALRDQFGEDVHQTLRRLADGGYIDEVERGLYVVSPEEPVTLACSAGHTFQVQTRDGEAVLCPVCKQQEGRLEWVTVERRQSHT
jgi:hypothetical protein